MDGSHATACRLGLMHGLSDAAAGFLIGCWAVQQPLSNTLALVLVYNLLAFALQPLAALVPLRWHNHALRLCLLLSALVLLAPDGWVWPAAVCIGLASCGFHVFAGSLSLNGARGNSALVGCFVGPGVLGLLAGMVGALQNWPGLGLGISAGLLISTLMPLPAGSQQDKGRGEKAGRPDKHIADVASLLFWIITGLLLFIALRSAVWGFYQNKSALLSPELLLQVAACACAGKLAGGWLANRFHWQKVLLASLLLASAGFFLFGLHQQTLYLLAGLACLQAGTPILLVRLNNYLPSSALAAALGLGTAIAVGGALLWLLPAGSAFWLWLLPALLAVAYGLAIKIITNYQDQNQEQNHV